MEYEQLQKEESLGLSRQYKRISPERDLFGGSGPEEASEEGNNDDLGRVQVLNMHTLPNFFQDDAKPLQHEEEEQDVNRGVRFRRRRQ